MRDFIKQVTALFMSKCTEGSAALDSAGEGPAQCLFACKHRYSHPCVAVFTDGTPPSVDTVLGACSSCCHPNPGLLAASRL